MYLTFKNYSATHMTLKMTYSNSITFIAGWLPIS